MELGENMSPAQKNHIWVVNSMILRLLEVPLLSGPSYCDQRLSNTKRELGGWVFYLLNVHYILVDLHLQNL